MNGVQKMSENNTTDQKNSTVDYSAIVSQYEGEVTARVTKSGECLPWSQYKDDVVGLLTVLCKEGQKTTTAILRQYLIKVLEIKIESMPKGKKIETIVIANNNRVEMTQKECYELRRRQFDTAKKSTINGPTITRVLGGKGAREYIKKHGFVYNSGFWKAVVTEVKNTQEEKSP